MGHCVQYHNPEKQGPFSPEEDDFSIFTKKSVDHLVGETIWLVSRRGDPVEYVLCMTFVVERVGRDPELGNVAWASRGRVFSPPVRIDREPWFGRLRYLTGNFAFGLQPINEEEVVEGLLRSSSQP